MQSILIYARVYFRVTWSYVWERKIQATMQSTICKLCPGRPRGYPWEREILATMQSILCNMFGATTGNGKSWQPCNLCYAIYTMQSMFGATWGYLGAPVATSGNGKFLQPCNLHYAIYVRVYVGYMGLPLRQQTGLMEDMPAGSFPRLISYSARELYRCQDAGSRDFGVGTWGDSAWDRCRGLLLGYLGGLWGGYFGGLRGGYLAR